MTDLTEYEILYLSKNYTNSIRQIFCSLVAKTYSSMSNIDMWNEACRMWAEIIDSYLEQEEWRKDCQHCIDRGWL